MIIEWLLVRVHASLLTLLKQFSDDFSSDFICCF